MPAEGRPWPSDDDDDVELLMMEVTGDHVDKCGLLFFQVQDRSMIYSPIQGREDAANVMKMEMLFVIVLMLGQWDMSLNHFGRTHVSFWKKLVPTKLQKKALYAIIPGEILGLGKTFNTRTILNSHKQHKVKYENYR